MKDGKKKGYIYGVGLTCMESVSVVGEFNDWDTEANPMERKERWASIPALSGIQQYAMYK